MSDGDWTWELTPKAQDDLAALDSHEQDRILDKLDEIVDSPGMTRPLTANHCRTVHGRKCALESSVSP